LQERNPNVVAQSEPALRRRGRQVHPVLGPRRVAGVEVHQAHPFDAVHAHRHAVALGLAEDVRQRMVFVSVFAGLELQHGVVERGQIQMEHGTVLGIGLIAYLVVHAQDGPEVMVRESKLRPSMLAG